jgi:hypothetical protein
MKFHAGWGQTTEQGIRDQLKQKNSRIGDCSGPGPIFPFLVLRRKRFLFILFALLIASTGSAKNLKLNFAQVVVGDSYVTVIDLVNNGTAIFYGALELRDNQGNFLTASINGTRDSAYLLSIQPKATQRLRLTRTGSTVAGHALIWDNLAPGSENYSQQINGSLFFQFLDGTTLLDSVGVSPSLPTEQFYFPAEYSSQALTGIALSEATGATVAGTVRAISDAGVLVATAPLTLFPWNHQAVFVNQILAVPTGFRGTVQIETSAPVYPLALRMEGNQFSTLPVIPTVSLYDFTINLPDGRAFRGETTFSISDNSVNGFIRFTNPAQDAGVTMLPLKGAGMAGDFIASTRAAIASRTAFITIYSDLTQPIKTSMDNIMGHVFWSEYGALPLSGTFTAIRRR